MAGTMLAEAASIKGDLPGHPFRGNQWTGVNGGGSWTELDRTAAKQEGLDVLTGSDIGESKLRSAADYIDQKMGDLEDARQDDSHEWKALSMMNTAIYAHINTKLSEKVNRRSAVVFKDDKIVAAGTMKCDKTNGHISHVGATEKGSGKYVVASLIRQAVDKKLKTITADASPDAVRLLSKFGFQRSGPDDENGTPMKWVVSQKSSRLAIAKHLLSVATQAVQLKRMLLKDQLRNAVVKAVHIKQYEQTEAELAEAVSGLIKRQFKQASKSVTESGSTKFDPRDWDDDLVDTCLPILMKHAGEAAAAQMLIMGVDIAPKKKVGRTEKGDLPGHPFRGNQWTGGAGGGPLSDEEKKTAHDAIDRLPVLEDEPTNVRASAVFPAEGMMTVFASPKKKNKVVARVPLDKLVKGQSHIPIAGLHAYVDEIQNELPEVIIEKGVMHINAGHTRLGALKLAGRTHAVVHFAEFVPGRRAYGEKDRYVDATDIVAPEGVEILDVKVKKSPSFTSTKTTATDWLLENEDVAGDLLWPEVFTLPSGAVVDMGFATEWPDWMKTEISKQMKETFSQPFWSGINDTTAKGIQFHVEKGLLEGLSIREIRQQMVGDGLDEYYHNRGINIARTESGNALNGARSAAMNRLAEEVPGLKVKRTWMSVLGTTTRDTHASLDGVPADRDGLWYLGGVRVPWPGHWNLPVQERACCQCTLTQSWGQSDETAEQLIEEYNERLAEERDVRDFWSKGDLPGHPFRGNQWSGGSEGGSFAEMSPDEAEAVYDATESWIGKLDPDVADVVDDYIGDGHRQLNHNLRQGPEALSKEDKQTARTIDDAMGPLQGDAVLFRGVDKNTWDDLYAGLKPGDSVRDRAFVSTSLEKQTADKFASGGTVEIAAPKGTMCLPVAGIGEMEILLPRGMEMKVVAVDHGRKVISVIPVSQGSRQPPGNPSEGWDFGKLQKSTKGDKPGHPFRGNQWGPGRGGAESGSSDDYGMTTALDVLTGKQPPNAASTVRRIDQTSVKSDKALGKGGVNTTRIVEIEEPDGTTGKYVFKPDDGENPGVHPAFHGHQSSNEVAASIVDEALGLDMVAKTEMVEIDGKKGSLQKWVNDDAKVADALIEWDENDMVKDSSKADNAEGVADMMYFDALIGNHDRHINNWMVKDGKVKLIDNGMSMADNMEYGDISFRTMEHAKSKRMMTRMTPKFKDALGKLIANKEQTDARLREAGIGATQRESFWKRAEYLRKAGMIGFGDSTLRDLGRLAEGRQLF